MRAAAPLNWADSASRILRPRAADGHDAATFPDLLPDAHRQDHLRRRQRRRRHHRLGLGRPGLSRPAQRAGPALQAALRLHGHRPERPDPAQHGRQPGGQRAGFPSGDATTTTAAARPTPRTWATRSARSTRPTRSRTPSIGNYDARSGPSRSRPGGANTAVNTQVDNVGRRRPR